MKRRELIQKLEELGCHFERHGSRHDIYRTKKGGKVEVPRHREIVEGTARAILKDAGMR